MAKIAENRKRHIHEGSSAFQLLNEMFKQIVSKHYNCQESWEILIEVLGQHLGITRQPFLYSNPKLDVEAVTELSPIHQAPFYVPKIDPTINLFRELLGLPPKMPKITNTYPHFEVYLSKDIRFRLRIRNIYRSRASKDAADFVRKFRIEGLLDSYIEKARLEAVNGESEKICAGVDHLGALFEEYELAGRKNRLGQMLTPMNIVKMMTMMVYGESSSKEPQTIMDPATGTGRFLIVPTIMFPYKPLVLYGIEIDLVLYRCALVNMALYSQHPYYIVCADALLFNIDSPSSYAWSLIANQWDPQDISHYYYGYGRELQYGHGLSFEELMKRKAERLQAEKDLNIISEPIIVQQSKRIGFSLEKYVQSRANKK